MKKIFVGLCIVALVALVVGPTIISSRLEQSLTYSANLGQAMHATVMLTDDEGGGSGVILGPRTILTAAHVVGDDKQLTATTYDGQTFTATPTWIDKAQDLVLLSVPEDLAEPSLSISCSTIHAGDELSIIGHPLLVAQWSVTYGHVASDKPVDSLVPVDVTIIPGNSGGPVLNSHGELVGLADAVLVAPLGFSASLTGLGLIVPMTSLCSTLPLFAAS